MMESELSQKYPDIRTFIGVSTQETGTKIRIDYTSEGFRAVVSSIDKDKIFIDHYQRGDKNTRIVYFKKIIKESLPGVVRWMNHLLRVKVLITI